MIGHKNVINSIVFFLFLLIGGYNGNRKLDTVEVVSADPISNPVPECMKNISSFPVEISSAVGTTFGALENITILLRF